MLSYSSSTSVTPFQVKCAPRLYMIGHNLKWHAWCPELNREVTASEVWHLLFSNETITPPLSFQCIDERCRAHLILKNCYAHMTDDEAQFRLYPRSRHHYDCWYVVEQNQQKSKLMRQRRQAAMHATPRPRSRVV